MRLSGRQGFAFLFCGMVLACLLGGHNAVAQVAPSCSPTSPAPISGSTGAQGVLDSINWPSNAAIARIDTDTGGITFLDSANATVGSGTLPGGGSPGAFPDGKLHFTSVHLRAGKEAQFVTNVSGLSPPVSILSCEDVILDAGSKIGADSVSVRGPLPGAFLGGAGSLVAGVGTAGFGPRTGSMPSAGSLYPPVGGGGGDGGGGVAAGQAVTQGPDGGGGGPAFLISARQRITLDGIVDAAGLPAGVGATSAQGGAGGSVRLAALLVEGVGQIDTSGSPAGPVEIQAFLQDLFTGTTTGNPLIRNNAPVAPMPTNLPTISIDTIEVLSLSFFDSGFLNTGSLTTPDVTLPQVSSPVLVSVSGFAQNVPLGTPVTFRAVGTDGSVATATDTVVQGPTSANLTLNPGVTYQIVVTPDAPFSLANLNSNPLPLADKPIYAILKQSLLKDSPVSANLFMAGSKKHAVPPVKQWARAFGAIPEGPTEIVP